MKVKEVQVQSGERYEFVPITSQVRDALREIGVEEGVCTVLSTHTTAAVTVNEDADPNVARDLASASKALVSSLDVRFAHGEGNSDSHILTSLFGPSQQLLLRGGELELGRWQGIFLAEFDGPRRRTVRVAVSPA